MALPILAKSITSALVKKGADAKKESKKVSAEKLLPGSVGNKVKVSKFKSRTPRPYRKKFEPTKFLPPSKIDENFDMAKLDDLLASLVDNTKDLEKITKKDVVDEKKKNTQKKNAKEKLKRSKREEETEEKKAVTKVKSAPMKFKAPDFFKDILAMGGRLVLAVGIMQVLNFLSDPEKKDGLISFLSEHMNKIVIGTLAILGTAIVASFIPVIKVTLGLVGVFIPVVKFLVGTIIGLLANPVVLKGLTLLAAGIAVRELLYRLEGPVREFYENEVQTRVNDYQYGDRAEEGQFIRNLRDNYGRISTQEDRAKLTDEERTTARFLKIYEEKLKEIATLKRQLRSARGPNNKRKIRDQIAVAEEALNGIASQLKIGGKSLSELQRQYEMDGSLPQTSIQKGTTVQPMVKPQTDVMPGVKLGGLKGDSGSVAYEGQERAPLSTQYSPFAQSDIDEQGMSIISGKGYRRSTGSDHKGFDIPAIEGTPVYAYLPGEITQNRYASGYGNIVEWRDSKYGQTHMFAHLKEPGPLSVGTKFEAGTMLARTGDTGTPGSYHLHWEIGAQGSEVDPGEWVKKHPINFSSTPKDQNVSYQAPYEKAGTQIAMIQVPMPVPMPSGGVTGGGGFTGSSSGSVNIYEDLVLTTHYREA